MHSPKREDPLLDLGYERRDIDMMAIGKAAAWFFGFSFISYIAGWLILRFMNPDMIKVQAASPPFVQNPPPAPNPLLQTNITTKTDIRELRQKETQALTTSAVLDAQHGVYRIPVDRAIDLTLQRGLPQRPSNVSTGGK